MSFCQLPAGQPVPLAETSAKKGLFRSGFVACWSIGAASASVSCSSASTPASSAAQPTALSAVIAATQRRIRLLGLFFLVSMHCLACVGGLVERSCELIRMNRLLEL